MAYERVNNPTTGLTEIWNAGQRVFTGTASAAAAFQQPETISGAGLPNQAQRSVIATQLANKPAVQQTTTPMRTEAAKNGAKLDEYIARISGSSGQAGTPETTTGQNNTTGTPGTPTQPAPATGPTAQQNIQTQLDKDISSAQEREKGRVEYATTTLDSIASRSDTATKALIDSIKTTYSARIKLMEDSNRRLVAAREQKGMRSGRAKYITDLHEGVISDEENQGLYRVGQLEGQMLSLIAQAEQARTKQDLEIFNTKMSELNDAYDDMRNEVQNLQKNAYDQLKLLNDAATLESNKQKEAFQQQLDKSERVAPALADAIRNFETPEERADFMQEYSRQSGLDMEILWGDVLSQISDEDKAKLDIQNIESQIENRKQTAASSKRQADISAAREGRLAREAEEFKPSEKDRSLVGKYLAKNGTDEDVAKAKTDEDFFYYILGLAEEEDL